MTASNRPNSAVLDQRQTGLMHRPQQGNDMPLKLGDTGDGGKTRVGDLAKSLEQEADNLSSQGHTANFVAEFHPRLQSPWAGVQSPGNSNGDSIRKGVAIRKSLTELHTNAHYSSRQDDHSSRPDTCRIHPADVLFGVMPKLSLARGKEVMAYLQDGGERISSYLRGGREEVTVSHFVPDHPVVLENGLGALIENMKKRAASASNTSHQEFYESVRDALNGMQGCCLNCGTLAKKMAAAPDLSGLRTLKTPRGDKPDVTPRNFEIGDGMDVNDLHRQIESTLCSLTAAQQPTEQDS